MKKVFLVKYLDTVSLIYLYIFFCNSNSTIKYRDKSNSVKKIIYLLHKFSKIEIEEFKNELFIHNNESIFYKNQSITNKLSRILVKKIFKGETILHLISKKIDIETCKTITLQSISTEIYDYVLFSNYCKYSEKTNKEFFVCIELFDLYNELQKELGKNKLKFIKIFSLKNLILFRIVRLFINLFFQLIRNTLKLSNNSSSENLESKIAINYFTDLKSPFSEHWWLKNLKIDKKNIVFYFSEFGKVSIDDNLANTIEKYGYSYLILDNRLNKTSKVPTENLGLNTGKLLETIKNLIKIYSFKRNYKFFKFQFFLWLKIIFKVYLYEQFLKKNNIKIVFDYSEANIDILGIAAKVCNSKKIYYQRTELHFPLHFYQPIHDIYFTWGELSRTVLEKYHNNKITKFVNVGNIFYSYPEMKDLKKNALRKINQKLIFEGRINLAIFDRSASQKSFVPPKYHAYFFDKLFKFAEENEKINLLIKPKDELKNEVLGCYNIVGRKEKLVKEKKLFIFNSKDSFYEAAVLSDVSLSIGINTAGVISSIFGVRPFFWDILNIAKSDYYEITEYAGYNDDFFTSKNLETLICNIIEYCKNKDVNKKIDQRFIDLRNHFNDKSALKRISDEINQIILK